MGEWTSVDERMPSAYEEVMIFPRPDFGVEYFTGHYHTTGNGTAYGSSGFPGWFCSVYEQYSGMEMVRVQVTHWMPIPTVPV